MRKRTTARTIGGVKCFPFPLLAHVSFLGENTPSASCLLLFFGCCKNKRNKKLLDTTFLCADVGIIQPDELCLSRHDDPMVYELSGVTFDNTMKERLPIISFLNGP